MRIKNIKIKTQPVPCPYPPPPPKYTHIVSDKKDLGNDQPNPLPIKQDRDTTRLHFFGIIFVCKKVCDKDVCYIFPICELSV